MRIMVGASLANSLRDPTSKITKEKWTGGVVQVVEHLFCKHEDLSSNFNTAPNQKKKCRDTLVEASQSSKKSALGSSKQLKPPTRGCALPGAVLWAPSLRLHCL
jgi:hypothetical protein